MITAHFPTHNGKVMSWGFGSDSLDRKVAAMYVNRNNAAARRRGDDSKPYAVLTVEFEPRTEHDTNQLGREAYRAGLPISVGDNPVARELWINVIQTLPRAEQRSYSDAYHAGWKAEQRALNLPEALRADVEAAQKNLDYLIREYNTETHYRRKNSLRERRDAARTHLANLTAQLEAAEATR